MPNQRRSHSLQPINRAQVTDPDSQELPDPEIVTSRQGPIAFQPNWTVNNNIELINNMKHLIIRASELHQDIDVKLTILQLILL
jgi:hypothetical protein